MPPVEGSLVTMSNGDVLIIGGRSQTDSSAQVEKFSPGSNTWREQAPVPVPRNLAIAAALPGGKVLVAGGRNNAHPALRDAYVYTPN
ncbi:kelch repeat-containing protein [Nocardioides sp.]|uniref:kelch repeat-containing protein n=1 Tax=Nocardioides sp. TaxID=35761 RepID=UPI003514D0E9